MSISFDAAVALVAAHTVTHYLRTADLEEMTGFTDRDVSDQDVTMLDAAVHAVINHLRTLADLPAPEVAPVGRVATRRRVIGRARGARVVAS